ncbi:helix-turn-helix domain-containing protein [Butyricicoccus faecihominis]|uniref:helix-turn-helix domain-containing protein n=1 Tax=Butyricicoccus faecihominis TaxID=1712515 RepID=UPI00247AC9EE|nr:helix-turn-helix transcriptional regulator [Butyricicoccus faecihominis]MCQ5129105.1 helix-turn-helix domain-containing protein [Butyricicoccus faecihominis]
MVGARIKMLREEAQLSQAQLAKELDISQSALGNYERGGREPDAVLLIKLARYFHVTSDYLLGLSNVRTVKNVSISSALKLSDQAIEEIRKITEVPDLAEVFDAFLSDGSIASIISGISLLSHAKSQYYFDILNNGDTPIENAYFRFADTLSDAISNSKLDTIFASKSGLKNLPDWYVVTGKSYIDLCKYQLDDLFSTTVDAYVGSDYSYLNWLSEEIESRDALLGDNENSK